MKKIAIITFILISVIASGLNAQYSAFKVDGFFMKYPWQPMVQPLNSGGMGISYEHSMGKHFTYNLSFNYFQRNLKYTSPITSTIHYIEISINDHYSLSSEIRYYFNKKYNGFYLRAMMYADYIISSNEAYTYGIYSTHYIGHTYNSYYGGLGAGYSMAVDKSFNLESQMGVIKDLGYGFIYQGGFNAAFNLGK